MEITYEKNFEDGSGHFCNVNYAGAVYTASKINGKIKVSIAPYKDHRVVAKSGR